MLARRRLEVAMRLHRIFPRRYTTECGEHENGQVWPTRVVWWQFRDRVWRVRRTLIGAPSPIAA